MKINIVGWAVIGICLGTIAAGLSMRWHHSQINSAWASRGDNPIPSFSQVETDLRSFLDGFKEAKWRSVRRYRDGKVWCGMVSLPNPHRTDEYTRYLRFIWGMPYVAYEWKQGADLYSMKRRLLFDAHFAAEDEHYFNDAWRKHCNDFTE